MSFQYDFPPELLLSIFGEVESYEDLLTLAATCRRFNHFSLQVSFSNHNFDPNSKTIILRSQGPSLEIISALAMSLALRRTSLEHLSFDFGRGYNIRLLPHEIRNLTRYIMSLSTIDHFTLHLAIPEPYFPVAMDWKAAYVALLDAVIGKSCNNLHVETYQCLEEKNSLSIWKTPRWFRVPTRHSEADEKSNGEAKHLKDCFIQTFPTFLRPFYLRVLKVNAPVLTNLTFKFIFGRMTAIDWGFLITNVHLPVLKRFAISFGVIPQDAIITFLSKHSHITNFEYHHIKHIPKLKGVSRGLKVVFNHLEQLTTTPEHILRFLPTMDRMPHLTSVTIIIEDGHIDFGVAEQALRRLSSRVKKIELTLDVSSVSSGLEALPELVHFGSSFGREDGLMLRCVACLHILWGYAPNVINVLGQLTVWLKLFPELERLTLNSTIQPSSRRLVVERNTLPPFFEQVKLACPTIESISLQGESEWTLSQAPPLISTNHPNSAQSIR